MKSIKELLEQEYLGKTLTFYRSENVKLNHVTVIKSETHKTPIHLTILSVIQEGDSYSSSTDYGLRLTGGFIYWFD